ncbi:hypothetical protein [Streptomyces sp. RerS4]|uniref:hypothetical protein n=1 Tax=Streptomyces sp. RerS4 TaxID=2942449 RepID=UPI00201BDE8A|nr:hypothetical protein [Streptomyces sp. RerS4]UQX02499.1 hypothetical protein M4D82_19910 [Streptomyces sp. RerS4]
MRMQRMNKAVVAAALSGALLAGCGDGSPAPAQGDGKGDGKASSAPSPTPQGPTVLLSVPPAYAADKGWQQQLAWMPAKYSSKPPVAIGAHSDVVAYVTVAEDGYTAQVRQASTGRILFTGKPWQPPTPLSEAGRSGYEGDRVELPSVSTAYQDGREYVVLWAHGVTGGDALTQGKEVVRLAVYPADASGEAVAPLREIDVPLKTYGANTGDEENDLRVEDLGGGLQVRWNGPPLTGGNAHGAVAVDLATGTLDVCADSCAKGIGRVRTGKGWLVTEHLAKGFGVPGAWSVLKTAPPGTAPERYSSDGLFQSAARGHVLSRWHGADGDQLTYPTVAVHETATGRLEASMPCQAKPSGVVTSPNGRFLADGTAAFDLQRAHGTCLSAGAQLKQDLRVKAVADNGTAYAEVAGGAAAAPATAEVDLASGTGAPRLLPPGTVVPAWTLKDTAVFLTPGAGGGGLLISTLKQN